MSNRILLVEDDQSFGAVLKDYLTINNFEVTLARWRTGFKRIYRKRI
jgi:DNA-binding response OmpR family regulator